MQLSEVLAALDALPQQARQEVIDEAVKASAGRYMIPNPGPQTEAWLSEADETFYGGAAGGGKTTLICGLALEEYQPALILRRQATQLKGIEDELTRMLGGRDGYNSQSHVWRLPYWRWLIEGGFGLPDDFRGVEPELTSLAA